MARLSFLFLPALLLGCHAKFKREAPTLGAVRTQVVTTGAPYVELGKVYTTPDNGVLAIAAAVVNIAQEINAVDQAARIGHAVQIGDVNTEFDAGIAESLGSGPPFAWTNATDAPATLQLEVLAWGLNVPYLGAPGEFTYDIRARIYKKDGERVYSSRTTCTAAAGNPEAIEQVLGIVNNMRELDKMSDADINTAFADIAHWCGAYFVTRMRRHAG